jgi:hypothetical protein
MNLLDPYSNRIQNSKPRTRKHYHCVHTYIRNFALTSSLYFSGVKISGRYFETDAAKHYNSKFENLGAPGAYK